MLFGVHHCIGVFFYFMLIFPNRNLGNFQMCWLSHFMFHPWMLLYLNQVISGRRHVGIMSAEPVGNYGVRYFKLGHYSLNFSFRDILFSIFFMLMMWCFDNWVDVSGLCSMICIKLEYIRGTISIILGVTSLPSWKIISKY